MLPSPGGLLHSWNNILVVLRSDSEGLIRNTFSEYEFSLSVECFGDIVESACADTFCGVESDLLEGVPDDRITDYRINDSSFVKPHELFESLPARENIHSPLHKSELSSDSSSPSNSSSNARHIFIERFALIVCHLYQVEVVIASLVFEQLPRVSHEHTGLKSKLHSSFTHA